MLHRVWISSTQTMWISIIGLMWVERRKYWLWWNRYWKNLNLCEGNKNKKVNLVVQSHEKQGQPKSNCILLVVSHKVTIIHYSRILTNFFIVVLDWHELYNLIKQSIIYYNAIACQSSNNKINLVSAITFQIIL